MWAALPNGTATVIAPDGVRRDARLCESAYVDVFDCFPRNLADSTDWPAPQPIAAAANAFEKPPSTATHHDDAMRVTYTITLLSDYRRGGASRSGGKPALQGGVDLRLPDHWNFGARGSSIAKHGNVEIAFYGTKTLEIGDTDLSIGATFLAFPRDPSAGYASVQASASRPIGPIDATVSVIYWPTQSQLNGEDSSYVVARARSPIGEVLGAPVTLGASIGRMRGHFADSSTRTDWSVSLTGRFDTIDIGITYVDNDLGDSRGRPGAVFSITRSF
ncbi:MAG: hypothetical protein HY054_14615 [Proteobacteria bacterium]|nr:hypothetical protein [Pseudomonadota bacterium]